MALTQVRILDFGELLKFLAPYDIIMSFCPLEDEPDVGLVNQWILDNKKNLACPKIKGEDLLACQVFDFGKLNPGKWWILEPKECKSIELKKIEIVLVPGQKFDIYGHRKWRGRGYYDRFLAKLPGAIKIWVLKPKQLVDKLNPNPWDIKMDILVKI